MRTQLLALPATWGSPTDIRPFFPLPRLTTRKGVSLSLGEMQRFVDLLHLRAVDAVLPHLPSMMAQLSWTSGAHFVEHVRSIWVKQGRPHRHGWVRRVAALWPTAQALDEIAPTVCRQPHASSNQRGLLMGLLRSSASPTAHALLGAAAMHPDADDARTSLYRAATARGRTAPAMVLEAALSAEGLPEYALVPESWANAFEKAQMLRCTFSMTWFEGVLLEHETLRAMAAGLVWSVRTPRRPSRHARWDPSDGFVDVRGAPVWTTSLTLLSVAHPGERWMCDRGDWETVFCDHMLAQPFPQAMQLRF